MPLESLAVTGEIADSLAILELTQAYRNREAINIEAIYTFPLPFDGVLLGLQATIGGRVLSGSVMPKQQAEDDYEDAITDGNSAIMLEQQAPGLYTLNLGNLSAGDDATIRIRYALPLKWTGHQLRIALPMTIGQRYGTPEFGKKKPYAVPEHDCIIEYPLSIKLSVTGRMSTSLISSPTHQLTTRVAGGSVEVGLRGGIDHPDRDLVLLLERKDDGPDSLTTVQNDNRQFGHAVFCIPDTLPVGPLATKLLIDCSGSMAGSSMAVARKAIARLLKQSKAGDQLSLTAFGSHFVHFQQGGFHTVSDAGLPENAVRWLHNLDADLGGTEMETALRAVFPLCGSEVPANVLMITDGEIWDIDGVITASRNAGQRVFVIGVGLNPAESNLRALAEATGGFVEFLSPAESVAPAVDRQLNRMRQPVLSNAKLQVPGDLQWVVPNPETTPLYGGDTVHFWYEAWGNSAAGQATLVTNAQDGERLVLNTGSTKVDETSELARLATAARLRAWDLQDADMDQQDGYTELAMAHQLVTPLTNFLMIDERQESAEVRLPELRPLKHLIPPTFMRRSDINLCVSSEKMQVMYELPRVKIDAPGDAINRYFDAYGALPLTVQELTELSAFELEPEIASVLDELVAQRIPEECVLLVFWNAVRKTSFKREMNRKVIWWIKSQRKLADKEKRLSKAMVTALEDSVRLYFRWSGSEIAERLSLFWK